MELGPLSRSDFFQGDKGTAGLPAFPQLQPDTLAEYVSKNPHLFQPSEATQTLPAQTSVAQTSVSLCGHACETVYLCRLTKPSVSGAF